MGELREYANEFENLSKSIVEYLLRDTNAKITQTKLQKDGGYDIIVHYRDGLSVKCALFECKLRKGNLNLRDIAANVIIAFNRGAIALVAITNYDFTQQTGEELLDFCQHTVLNVKIIIGDELQHILEESNIDITDELYNYIDIKKTLRKDDFKAIRINFDESILKQIFPSKANYNLESNLPIEKIFSDEIKYIATALQRGKLIAVTGFLGVGKHLIIQEAFKKINKRIITVDAILHERKDLIVLEMLAQIWGISTTKIFSFFSQNDIAAIVETVGDRNNKKEIIELLTALLNDTYADKHISALYNVWLCNYIVNLLALHKEDIGFVIYIKNLQFASREIFDFLIYFIKYIATSSIGCVVIYQEPEYKLQEGKNFLEKLCHMEQYVECPIKLLSKEKAILYVEEMYPKLPCYIVNLIVSKAGTRLYNLSHLLKSLFPNSATLSIDSNIIIQKLQFCTPNNVPNLLAQSLVQYKENYPRLFEICYLFECRVPVEICDHIEHLWESLEYLTQAGIFCCNYGVLMAQNEFVQDWIMHAYSHNSPSIQIMAVKLLNDIQPNIYNVGYINMYRILGRNEDALLLLDKNLSLLKKEKQYTFLKKGLIQAVEIAKSSHNYIQEIKYLTELLEIITIQKEIATSEAEKYIDQLKNYARCNILPQEAEFALSFFILKHDFKLGIYTTEGNTSIQDAKNYYERCMQRELNNNTDDWLGRICSCYALFVKSTHGNEAALKIFENALEIFPDSFDLRREYFSHIACMQLFKEPIKAFSNYQKILDLFEEEARDSAALPFHEYGDLAMCQLIAKNFDYALLLSNSALEISRANGLLDEEGRCLNIQGCIKWCQGDLQLAETSFREATAIMRHSGYSHYAWRSQLNILQLNLMTENNSYERVKALENLYTDFALLLSNKIRSLSKSDSESFRNTIEYHALLIFGVLWNKLTNDKRGYLKICKDFELREHNKLYKKDVCSFLSGDYDFMESPYIQNGYIYFVG